MGNAGIFYLNGEPIYGWLVISAEAVRLRVSAGEWRTLDVGEGSTVSLESVVLTRRLLISSVVAVPDTGLVWVELLPTIVSRFSFAGVDRRYAPRQG